jgi:hypothetical protein
VIFFLVHDLFLEMSSRELPFGHLVLAGGLSGICVDLLLFPLDTLKTRLQVRTGTALPPFSVRVFYRGLLSSMLSSFPCAASFWLVYKSTESHLRSGGGSLAASTVLASSLAEALVCCIRTPFDVIKQQLQAGHHASTREAVRAIVSSSGVRGLYAGLNSAREWRPTSYFSADVTFLVPPPPIPPPSLTHSPSRSSYLAQCYGTFPLQLCSLPCTMRSSEGQQWARMGGKGTLTGRKNSCTSPCPPPLLAGSPRPWML